MAAAGPVSAIEIGIIQKEPTKSMLETRPRILIGHGQPQQREPQDLGASYQKAPEEHSEGGLPHRMSEADDRV